MKERIYKLSVLVPGIRTVNWRKLYDSVAAATKESFELVFVGPYELPKTLKALTNVQYTQDWGSPIRCQQIALLKSKGEWITWAADDGEFLPGSLDIGFSKLENNLSVVMGKYLEGKQANESGTQNNILMKGNHYYTLANHDASRSPWLPKHYLMLNVGLISWENAAMMGGWDCRFEVCPMAYNDFAIRLQNEGSKFIVQDEVMFTCSHLPGYEGDHGPVHDGQVEHDQPLFTEIYMDKRCTLRDIINIDNWKNSPERWGRRFGNG